MALPTTRELDCNLCPSPYSVHDIVISLPHRLIDDIFKREVNALVQAWPYFPPIPPRTRRIWIYDQSVKAITSTVCLDYHHYPARLYQLIDSVTLEIMEGRHNYGLNQVPGPAPNWLCNHAKNRKRVW